MMNINTYKQLRNFVREGDPLDYIREADLGEHTIHWCAGTGEDPSAEGFYIIIRTVVSQCTLGDVLELDFAYWDGEWWLSTHNTGHWSDRVIPLAYVEDREDHIVDYVEYVGLDE